MAFRGIEESLDAGQREVLPPATDLARWSLEVDKGRQVWRYLEEGEDVDSKQNPVASAYFTGADISKVLPDLPPPKSIRNSGSPCPPFMLFAALASWRETRAHPPVDISERFGLPGLRNGIQFFSKLQTSDGHWAGDYGGPMFLLPGYTIVMHITKVPIPEATRLEIIRYLSNLQTEEGGWGIHIESLPTVFGTALNYVVMRLLGVARDDPRLSRARDWLEPRGGCLGIPSWGKFWLATLGVFQWEGVHSLFPEMALLPRSFPLHTARMWSYCRTVYMPMSFIYGSRFSGPITKIVEELREELIFEPYHSVDWPKARSFVAPEDLYTPHTWPLEASFAVFNAYEKVAPQWLRSKALDWVYELLRKEDEFTKYIDIGPVNKMINMLCVWVREGQDSSAFREHVARVPDYLWMGHDGLKMNGTNGSQLWDTSFMVQALIESGIKDEFADVFRKAHDYVDVAQIRVDHPDHDTYYRDQTKGGWPFSTRDIGWVVADCTGEGLKAALICRKHNFTRTPLSETRLYDAVNILLLMQNDTGGYATCEKTRGWHFFEWFNASEVFGEIMIDYDYVECTSSALQALCLFREMFPEHRKTEVTSAIKRATDFMMSIQLDDGSWEGMWGICFTYGTWFGVEGLVDAGFPPDHPRLQRACQFLVAVQKQDGGWGETFMSCVERRYVQHPQSQVVNTAWAVLSLLKAEYPDQDVIRRGVLLLIERQQPNGDWVQESISGVFNKNAMISYSNYKNIFPLWAIGRYCDAYPDDAEIVLATSERQ